MNENLIENVKKTEIIINYLPSQKDILRKNIYKEKSEKIIIVLIVSSIILFLLSIISIFKTFIFVYTSIPGIIILLSVITLFLTNEKAKKIVRNYIPKNNMFSKKLIIYGNKKCIILNLNEEKKEEYYISSVEKKARYDLIKINFKKEELYIQNNEDVYICLKNIFN